MKCHIIIIINVLRLIPDTPRRAIAWPGGCIDGMETLHYDEDTSFCAADEGARMVASAGGEVSWTGCNEREVDRGCVEGPVVSKARECRA